MRREEAVKANMLLAGALGDRGTAQLQGEVSWAEKRVVR